MALLTIVVCRTGPGGGTAVRVELASEADTMPHEHEATHGRLVAALLPGAVLERERPAREPVVG